MKCRSCDVILTDFEATRKYSASGEYVDLCSRCLSPIVAYMDTSERFDLYDPDVDIIDEEDISKDPSTITTADGERDE